MYRGLSRCIEGIKGYRGVLRVIEGYRGVSRVIEGYRSLSNRLPFSSQTQVFEKKTRGQADRLGVSRIIEGYRGEEHYS